MTVPPQNIDYIFSLFNDCSTYIYGRAVREMLMGSVPKSCRIITSTPVSALRRMFPRGRFAKGKVKALIGGIECSISASGAELEDLCVSQDFTIDSAAYSDITGMVDRHGAQHDIKNRIIRFNRENPEHVCSDPLIMLKAVRLCAELDFTLAPETEKLIIRCAPRIKSVSPHSAVYELEKLLMSKNPDYFRILHRLGLLKYLMPQLDICFGEPQKNKYHIYDVGEHIMCAVKNTPNDYVLRWAALLHDVGKPCCSSTDNNGIIHFYGHHHESRLIADDILYKYGVDRDAAKDILTLIENHDVRVDPNPISVKKMMYRTGGELFEKLMILQTADNMAKDPKYFTEKYRRINEALKTSRLIKENNEPFQYSQLNINSRDILKLGSRPGRETSDIMRTLMDEVITDPTRNTREYLISRAKAIIKSNQ